MIVIALYNLKGGVGKTASCVNLSYLAAKDGYKTLLWDIDPQGATSFYFKAKPKTHPSIKKLISKDADLEAAVLATDYEHLDLIPADNSAKSFDIMVNEMQGNKNRLKNILKQFEGEYDFVFIDCPPGFSALSENIFNAADIVLMPVIPTTLSVRTYNMVKDYFKEKSLDVAKLMCFFTMTDLRKNMHHEIMTQLFKDKRFFGNYIPYLSDVEKMGIHKMPIEAFAKSSYAAQCYAALWTEITEGVLE
ncbi:ParA family protein [Ferruginibacter yonginensis]|uniref:ParA family protein n=1 Tax=Ferruginibacter yonginensis TaxID=1310416 RepID=A0ABV8QVU7_9BACT